MTKEKYLEKLSKMDGLDLIDELANRKRAINEEINAKSVMELSEKYKN